MRETVNYTQINTELPADSGITAMIRPYKSQLDAEMNAVIAHAAQPLPKGKPESLLGNFVAEAVLQQCRQYHNEPIDFSVVNYGGIRIPALAAGPVTKGKVFELMPFENFLVVMTLNGQTVYELVNHIAQVGGWPVAGIRFKVEEHEAIDIEINGRPFDKSRHYRVAISDYLANGGDKLYMLKDKERVALGILFRDALFNYFKELDQAGKKADAQIDGRITYVR